MTMPQPTQSSPKFYLSILVGIIAIGVGIYFAFFGQVKNSLQWILIISLFIFGIASLTELWTGRINVENKFVKATRTFAICVALFVLILNKTNPPTEESSLKIQVKDWQGTSVLANKNQAIKIISGKFSKTYDLNSDSEILLTFMRNADSVEIEVLDDNWQLAKQGKSAFFPIPQNEIITLFLVPSNARCCLHGKVVFDDNKPHDLANITVQAEGVTTKTNTNGSYVLELPIHKKLQAIPAYAKMGNYEGTNGICNTSSPCDILLTKKK